MLGADLRKARERRGLTQRQVAEHAGISEGTIKSIENMTNYPTLASLESIAECLRIRVIVGPHETLIEYVDD